MSNINSNRLLFQLFMVHNAEKTFNDFGKLKGLDTLYENVKLKDFDLYYNAVDDVELQALPNKRVLCSFSFIFFEFFLFDPMTKMDFNILDHIPKEDLI